MNQADGHAFLERMTVRFRPQAGPELLGAFFADASGEAPESLRRFAELAGRDQGPTARMLTSSVDSHALLISEATTVPMTLHSDTGQLTSAVTKALADDHLADLAGRISQA